VSLKKNTTDESGKQFWSYVERAAARVKDWPEWKRGGAAELSESTSTLCRICDFCRQGRLFV
jgi:hypothetical protein